MKLVAGEQATLHQAARSRVIRDTLALQGSPNELEARPADFEWLAARTWAPKSCFTRDSTVVGLDILARALARPTQRR